MQTQDRCEPSSAQPARHGMHSIPTPIRRRLASRIPQITSKSLINPSLHMIEEILHDVGILTGNRFARNARRLSMRGAFDHDEVLVLTLRKVVVNLVEP